MSTAVARARPLWRALASTVGASALLLSACSSGGMVKIMRDPDAAAPAPSLSPSPPTTPPRHGTAPSGLLPSPQAPTTPVLASGIQPDLMCATPQEDFDIMGTVKTRLGTEAAARLTRLLSTDFKNADLTAKDRELLKFIARETLWIPPWVERWIGDAYFKALGDGLVPIGDAAFRQRDFAVKTLTEIVNASPQTPFEIELMVVQSGTPSGAPGGRMFVDQATVRNAMQGDKGRKDKLTYILAHELAHIYKRHKAKRLQEQLISIDEAHNLIRILLKPSNVTSSVKGFLETFGGTAAIVDGLFRHQADFLRAQEVEADACAAALLMNAQLGDPVNGFAIYTKERTDDAKGWTVYSEHPPDEQRKLVISYVATNARSRKAVRQDDVMTNLAKHIKSAAQRDK